MDINNISTKDELIACLNKINEIIEKERITDLNYYDAYATSFLLLNVENHLKNIKGR